MVTAQNEWVVPQDKKGKLSPFEFSETSKSKGELLYKTNCMSCHGNPGKADFQKLTPSPGDPAMPKFQLNRDGELFYKISEGRELMPSFKNVISQDEIWELISYLRSFNAEYEHSFVIPSEKSAYGGIVTLALSHLKDKGKIIVEVKGLKNGLTENIEGAEVVLRVKRTFGNLIVDEPKVTDNNGFAEFLEPLDIPGDKDGNLNLIAQLSNQDLYGVTIADTILSVGKQFTSVSLTQDRAMWNTVKKAPVWLIFSFSIAVFLAWGTIFYVILQLKKIFDIGNR